MARTVCAGEQLGCQAGAAVTGVRGQAILGQDCEVGVEVALELSAHASWGLEVEGAL